MTQARGKIVKTLPCVGMLMLCMATSLPVLALEQMSDADMSRETGKGIAFLPENFKIQFDDTAFIHIKPVGPVANAAINGLSPLDIYMYGLTIGKSNASTADRTVGTITSWGSGSNAFIIKAYTPTTAYEYNTTNNSSIGTLSIQAPDYLPATDTVGADGYNLKLATWTDFMIRNPNVVDPILANPSQASIGTANQFTDRMRLQIIWNGFSINGSQFNIFQTPSFAAGSGAASQSRATNTLGITGVLRLNSTATGVLRVSTQVSAGELEGAAFSPGTIAKTTDAVPTFNTQEGMYLTNLSINLPIGRLHYQPLTISRTGVGNNIALELATIPNNPTVYNDFYNAGSCTVVACTNASHGNIDIGNITFKDGTGTAVNLGSAAIDGVLINHFKFITTGL